MSFKRFIVNYPSAHNKLLQAVPQDMAFQKKNEAGKNVTRHSRGELDGWTSVSNNCNTKTTWTLIPIMSVSRFPIQQIARMSTYTTRFRGTKNTTSHRRYIG
jgi:hypothetical protein